MNLNLSCNSLLFASYSKPSDSNEEKSKKISDESLDTFLSNNQLINRNNWGQSSVEFDEEELIVQHKIAEEEFDNWKITFSNLFQNDEIKKIVSGRTFPPMIDVEMDEIEVVLSKDHPFIGTSGVATCIAVIARGNGAYGPCLALSHTSDCGLEPEEVLKRMQKKMQSKDFGCRSDTIKFYVIGGKLPLFDGSVIIDSIDQERKFLSLAKQYNIVGAKFNLIDGEEGALEVVVSADEIVWQTDLDSEESSDDSLVINEKFPKTLHKSNIIKYFEALDKYTGVQTEEGLVKKLKIAKEMFIQFETTYSDLFQNNEIKKASVGKIFPKMIDVDMDKTEVVFTKDHPFISTRGVNTCIAVIARGESDNGTCIALSHTSVAREPEGVLKNIQKIMQSEAYGCRPDSIKFYVVGGKLPFLDGSTIVDSVKEEIKFLSLARQFNIVGVQFNKTKSADGCLDVIASEDEIIWKRMLEAEDSSDGDSFNIEPYIEGINGNDLSEKKVLQVERKRERDENTDEDLQVQVKKSREEYTLWHAMNRTKDLI